MRAGAGGAALAPRVGARADCRRAGPHLTRGDAELNMWVLELSGKTWLEDATRRCTEHRLVRADGGHFKSKEIYPWIKTAFDTATVSFLLFQRQNILMVETRNRSLNYSNRADGCSELCVCKEGSRMRLV